MNILFKILWNEYKITSFKSSLVYTFTIAWMIKDNCKGDAERIINDMCKIVYSQVSNKRVGWNKQAGMGKSWKLNKQAGWKRHSGLGKNLKMNKHKGSIAIF